METRHDLVVPGTYSMDMFWIQFVHTRGMFRTQLGTILQPGTKSPPIMYQLDSSNIHTIFQLGPHKVQTMHQLSPEKRSTRSHLATTLQRYVLLGLKQIPDLYVSVSLHANHTPGLSGAPRSTCLRPLKSTTRRVPQILTSS